MEVVLSVLIRSDGELVSVASLCDGLQTLHQLLHLVGVVQMNGKHAAVLVEDVDSAMLSVVIQKTSKFVPQVQLVVNRNVYVIKQKSTFRLQKSSASCEPRVAVMRA